MKTIAAVLLLLLVLGTAPSWSSMDTELIVLGFSADGAYIAYQVSGFGTGSALGFSMIQIADVAANDFATEDFRVEAYLEEQSLESMKSAVLSKAQPSLDRYGIVRGNTGSLVYQLQTKTPWEQLIQTEKSTELELVDAQGRAVRCELVLEEREVKADYCTNLEAFDLRPRIFTLSIRCQESSRVLQADKVLYRSRNCPYAYEVYRVYIYRDRIAVFLNARTAGWEGDDVYKLVVTGLLGLDFPRRGAPGSIEPCPCLKQ